MSNIQTGAERMPHDFFYSSRRRHTRSLRDWSSDVCSSDLVGEDEVDVEFDGLVGGGKKVDLFFDRGVAVCDGEGAAEGRSEERRVGKECRLRWSPSASN